VEITGVMSKEQSTRRRSAGGGSIALPPQVPQVDMFGRRIKKVQKTSLTAMWILRFNVAKLEFNDFVHFYARKQLNCFSAS